MLDLVIFALIIFPTSFFLFDNILTFFNVLVLPKYIRISASGGRSSLAVISFSTNISKYKKRAQKILKDILRRGKLPIICGGTGFWIKALVDDIDFPEVKPDWELRERLNKETPDALFKMLQKLDPKRTENIDAKNKVRLIRAIEICKSIGKVPKPELRIKNKELSIYEFLQIGIDIPKEILNERIKTRLEKRFEAGMVDEVDRLHSGQQKYLIHNTEYLIPKISWKRLENFGLEYYWISQYLQNKIELSEMKERLYFDSIHYAKRQMTWFRKDKRIVWLTTNEEIENTVSNFLR